MAIKRDLTGHAGNEIAAEARKLGKINLRASTIEQFIRCPYQYYSFHIAGEQTRAPSAAASLGTAVHKAMEVGLLEKIETGSLPPMSVLEDAAHENWMAASQDDEMMYNEATGENFDTVDKAVIAGANIYGTELMPTLEPIATERVFTHKIEDHPIIHALQGSIDIEEERGCGDLKVTKDRTQGNKHILQLSTYAHLRELNDLESPYSFIDNVIKGRKLGTKMRTERMPVVVKTDYAKFWIDQILETTAEFHKTGNELLFRGTNPTNNFLCNPKWCSKWDTCPYVAHLK